MREILFRGKRKDNGEWIEGQLLYFQATVGTSELALIVEGCEWDNSNEWFNLGKRAKVIPETIGQYTGLTDKNGTKIFEGDIVKHEYWVFTSLRNKELKTKIGYVDFSCDGYGNGYWAYWWNEETKRRCNFGVNSECEIIGNIHDNPELLKGGADNGNL